MPDQKFEYKSDNCKEIEPAFLIIKEKAKDIGFGRWKIELIIHQKKVVGFTQLESPHIEYREVWNK